MQGGGYAMYRAGGSRQVQEKGVGLYLKGKKIQFKG